MVELATLGLAQYTSPCFRSYLSLSCWGVTAAHTSLMAYCKEVLSSINSNIYIVLNIFEILFFVGIYELFNDRLANGKVKLLPVLATNTLYPSVQLLFLRQPRLEL